jgi:hypothetical protein
VVSRHHICLKIKQHSGCVGRTRSAKTGEEFIMSMLKRGLITSLVLASAIVLMPAVSIAEPTTGPMLGIVGGGENPWQRMDERVSVLEMSLADLQEELAELEALLAGGNATMQEQIDAINERINGIERRIADIEADLLIGAHIINGECPEGLVVTGVAEGVLECESAETLKKYYDVRNSKELGRLSSQYNMIVRCHEGDLAVSWMVLGLGHKTWVQSVWWVADAGFVFPEAYHFEIHKDTTTGKDNFTIGVLCKPANL